MAEVSADHIRKLLIGTWKASFVLSSGAIAEKTLVFLDNGRFDDESTVSNAYYRNEISGRVIPIGAARTESSHAGSYEVDEGGNVTLVFGPNDRRRIELAQSGKEFRLGQVWFAARF